MKTIPRNKRTEHQFTAFIDNYLNFSDYLGSYKNSFDILVENVSETKFHVDHLAYPILFIARHCMELGFKMNIRYFSKYSGKDDYVHIGTHDLEKLFGAFKMHVNETFKNLLNQYEIIVEEKDKKSFKELCKEVEKLNSIFHALDKKSDAFRYPIDKQQNPSFKIGERINVLDVADLLEKSLALFFHTADVFSKYLEYSEEIENHYETLMSEQQLDNNLPY